MGDPTLSDELAVKRSISAEQVLRAGVDLLALAALAYVILSGEFPRPFPILEYVFLVSIAAATRRYGLALPGKGFSSFVLGVVLFAILHRGWTWGVLVSPLGMLAGDIPLRGLRLRAAVTNASHLTFGAAVVGLAYDRLAGAFGAASLTAPNVLPLAFLVVGLPLVVNGTFYAELTLSESLAWVDARLTLRWESVVYLLSAAFALAWIEVVTADIPALMAVGVCLVLLGLLVLAHWMVHKGVRADELGLVERLSRAIASDVNLERSFATVRDLTQRTQARILKERPFHSLADFLARVAPRPLEAENLIKVGALDGFGTIPALLGELKGGTWRSGQMSLFSLANMPAGEAAVQGEDWNIYEKVAAQEEILGAGVSAHPLELVADQIQASGAITTLEAAARPGQRVRLVGTRQTWRRSFTARGEPVYFLALEDLEGMLDVVIFSNVYRRHSKEFSTRRPLGVEGVVELDQSTGEPFIRLERAWRVDYPI